MPANEHHYEALKMSVNCIRGNVLARVSLSP